MPDMRSRVHRRDLVDGGPSCMATTNKHWASAPVCCDDSAASEQAAAQVGTAALVEADVEKGMN